MILFTGDEAVDPIHPEDGLQELVALVGLLVGQDISALDLCPEARVALSTYISRIRAKEEGNRELPKYEEFNELLLLLNQRRIERPFFEFFFLNRDPRQSEDVQMKPVGTLPFRTLNDSITRFRGFAMLCFGNFRFAFRRLSEEKDPSEFMKRLYPWVHDSGVETAKLQNRQEPIAPLRNTGDEIGADKTWLLGYISTAGVKSDEAALNAVRDSGENPKVVDALTEQLLKLTTEQEETQRKGKRNTVKYLTWDYLDVYVATSMRYAWEFGETYNFVKSVFEDELKGLGGIRWFDPTQSYCESVIDKGLLEGLMLRRAKCTIYMAQEGDTLGKDSELAATLAQGKPVIAYVPQHTEDKLEEFGRELELRPIRYFRQRLLTLIADGFFDKPDNRRTVSRLASSLGLKVGDDRTSMNLFVKSVLEPLDKFYESQQFQIIGDEETSFRRQHKANTTQAARFLAAVESRAADNRADTIKTKHPLGMQVHLERGVANGVLVARTAKECASLVKGVLTRDMQFDITYVTEPVTYRRFASVLQESVTKSRFRVVTTDDCLTNSFWNFYSKDTECDLE